MEQNTQPIMPYTKVRYVSMEYMEHVTGMGRDKLCKDRSRRTARFGFGPSIRIGKRHEITTDHTQEKR
jgi:hypothetical protein